MATTRRRIRLLPNCCPLSWIIFMVSMSPVIPEMIYRVDPLGKYLSNLRFFFFILFYDYYTFFSSVLCVSLCVTWVPECRGQTNNKHEAKMFDGKIWNQTRLRVFSCMLYNSVDLCLYICLESNKNQAAKWKRRCEWIKISQQNKKNNRNVIIQFTFGLFFFFFFCYVDRNRYKNHFFFQCFSFDYQLKTFQHCNFYEVKCEDIFRPFL